MRHVLLLLTLACTATAQIDTDSVAQLFEGDWEWTSTLIAVWGTTVTPQTEGYTMTLRLRLNATRDSIRYESFEDDSLVSEGATALRVDTVIEAAGWGVIWEVDMVGLGSRPRQVTSTRLLAGTDTSITAWPDNGVAWHSYRRIATPVKQWTLAVPRVHPGATRGRWTDLQGRTLSWRRGTMREAGFAGMYIETVRGKPGARRLARVGSRTGL